MKDIGLQLFTLHDEVTADWKGTLSRVAEIGYKVVELAGQYAPFKEMKAFMDDLGMYAVGNHNVGFGNIQKDLRKHYEYEATLGIKYCVCPAGSFGNVDDFKRAAHWFNVQGEAAAEFGMSFLYHNHGHEFLTYDGRIGMDILLAEMEPGLADFELDLYWAAFEGADVVEWLKKFDGRAPLIHLKDMKYVDGEKTYAEIGNGVIDFPAILEVSRQVSSLYGIVEQDKCETPFESIKISHDYLRSLGI